MTEKLRKVRGKNLFQEDFSRSCCPNLIICRFLSKIYCYADMLGFLVSIIVFKEFRIMSCRNIFLGFLLILISFNLMKGNQLLKIQKQPKNVWKSIAFYLKIVSLLVYRYPAPLLQGIIDIPGKVIFACWFHDRNSAPSKNIMILHACTKEEGIYNTTLVVLRMSSSL